MPFEILPVEPDEFASTPAAPDAGPPQVGPKNVYRKGQPQVSETDTVTIPNVEQFVLPKVVDENRQAEPVEPEHKIEPVAEDEQMVPPSQVYDPKSDYALTRGVKTGFTGTGSSVSAALDMPRLATLPKEEQVKELLRIGTEAADPRNANLQVGDLSQIHGVGDFFTFLGESIGQTAGSWLGAATYGGVPGAAIGGAGGAAVGSLGAGVGAGPGALAGGAGGFTYGTLAAFGVMGVGGMLQDLTRDKAVQEGLKNGTISPNEILALASGSGAAAGALDALPAGKFVAKIGGKDVAKDVVKTLLRKAALKGALHEGGLEAGTEGIQQAISEVTTALAGGDYDVANRALNVLNAAVVGGIGGAGPGAVGGIVENARVPPPPAVDQTDAQEAAPATEPGVQTTPDAAGSNTPGDTHAGKPSPPAGSTATPAATPATTGIDPAVAAAAAATNPASPGAAAAGGAAGAGPAATPTSQPVVEEGESYPEDTGPVIPESPEEISVYEQQQAELARVTGEQIAAKQAEDAAKVQEQAAQTTTVSSSPEDIVAAITATQAKRKPIPTATTQAVDTGGNVAPITPAPLPAAPTPATETAPVVPVTATTPLAAEQAAQPLDTAIATAQGTAGIPEQIAEAAGAPAPVAPAAAPVAPAPAPVAPAPTPIAPAEPVAALQPAAQPTAARIEPVAADEQMTPVAAPAAPLTKGQLIKQRAREAEQARAKATAEGKPAEVKERGTLKVGVTAPIGAVRKGLKVVEIARKPAERVEPAPAPQAQPAAPTQPAAPPAAQAAKKAAAVRQASSDVAARVRQHPELTKSRFSELDDSLIGGTVDDVTREAATHEVEHAEGRSLNEIIRAVADRHAEILAEVKKRLQPKLEEHEAQFEPVDKSFEAKQEAAKREAEAKEAQAKVEKQAAATKGTGKERAGKEKGLSPTGIRARSADTWIKQAREQAGKEGADQRIARIRELVLEQRRAKTPEARKVEAQAEWKAIVEELANERQVELDKEAKAAETGINKEHRETERQLKNATAHLPLPSLSGSEAQQQSALKQHLADFLKAIERIPVAAIHSTEHNSPIENLAVFAHKLRKNERDVEGMGPLEFWKAQFYAESGALDNLRGLTTNESIKGSGLKEEVTEGTETGGKLTALHEDETSAKSRVHAETVAAGEVGLGDLALRKGGRQAAVARNLAEVRRANRSRWGVNTIQALDQDGNPIEIEAATASAAARLREVDPSELPDRGFFSLFRNMHIRRLTQMVGNVPVHIISSEDMQRISGRNALGLYRGYSDADRARGVHPEVFITEEAANNMGSLAYGHVLVHELTHAATVMAYRENVRGTRKLIDRMRVALIKDLRRQGHDEYSLNEMGVDYGLFQETGNLAGLEFIAEAFSNPEFQAMLASLNVPRSIQADVAAITGGRLQSWWDAFTAAVSNAIGMIGGRRGATYMDTVVALHPHLMRSSAWQDARARENDFSKMMEGLAGDRDYQLPRAVPNGPADTLMLTAELKQRVEGMKERAASGSLGVKMRGLAYKLMTTGELKRRAAELFGGVDNAFNRLADVLLMKEPLRKKFRAMGNRIEAQLQEFQHKNRAMYLKLSEFLHEASRRGIDPMVPLNHVNNRHIAKTGARSAGRRAAHARMAREWAQFPAEVQTLARDAAQHYRTMHDLQSAAHIKHAVQAAMKKYRATEKLPAGKTMDDVVEWVRSGAAARKEDERTADDKAFHAALGKTASTLADISELRKLDGLYFPLARRGKWFITAIEKLATPVGAVADPSSPDGNRFLFVDEKKLADFIENTNYIVKVTSRWVDPLTFRRTIKSDDRVDPATGQLVHPVQQFVATVQNRRLEMHDNRGVLAQRQKELQAEGHQVSAIGLTEHDLHDMVGQIAPKQIAAMLRNSEQTTVGSTTLGQQAIKDAMLDSYIRSITTPSALTHRLKREGTLGYDLDLNSAMREYNRSTASHLANLELAPQEAEHQAALQEDINARRRSEPDTRIEQLQQLQKELAYRIKQTTPAREGTLSRFADALMNTSYLRHLFSPHYTIINSLQPFMTTYPVLAAKYGDGAAWREIIRAYRIGGVRKTLGRGFSETWQAARNINPYAPARVVEAELDGLGVHDKLWRDLVAGEDDAAELHDVFDAVTQRGFGASGGIEAGPAAEADLNTVEKTLSRLTNVAKGLPEAAEGINRYTAAIAEYRLARRAGLSHEAAKAEAVSTVEQTQGGYARANNPVFMQNPLLRLPMQFKKYGLMYGQMYYGNVAKLVAPSTDPEQRKMARKALVRLSATTMIFAGAGGLPFIELARIFANVAMGLGATDDDWDDDENAMQEWFASFVGNPLSEAVTHGLTRLVGIDTSNSLGADNLITFGQPRNMDEDGFKSWMFDALVLGAGGDMAVDSLKAIHEGDYAGALPWPKVIKNLTDAIGLYSEGTVSKTSGEEYAPPVNIGEAIVKGLGFQPASSARQWETTGGGRASKEERQLFHQRNQLFDKWNRARLRSGPAAAAQVFADDVREWNRTHPEKKFRIDMGDLMRSKREHDRATRERERAAAAQ